MHGLLNYILFATTKQVCRPSERWREEARGCRWRLSADARSLHSHGSAARPTHFAPTRAQVEGRSYGYGYGYRIRFTMFSGVHFL